MPSAMGGFHEILTKSLNELNAMLVAEHDREVGELQHRLLFLECKLAGVGEPSIDDSRPPTAALDPTGAPVNITRSENAALEVPAKRHMKAASERNSLHSRQSMRSESSNIRNVHSEGTKGVFEKGVGGVRQFIRSAMRRRIKAQTKSRPTSANGRASARTSVHSNRTSLRSTRASLHSNRASLHDNVHNRMSISSKVSRNEVGEVANYDSEDRPVESVLSQKESKKLAPSKSGDATDHPIWSAQNSANTMWSAQNSAISKVGDAQASDARSASRQNRHSASKESESQEEDWLDDNEDNFAPVSSVTRLAHLIPTQHEFPPRLSLAQRLTLMALSPEIAAIRASAAAPSNTQAISGQSPVDRLASFSALLGQDSLQARLSGLSGLGSAGLSDFESSALQQVLFSDGLMPNDESIPCCGNCGTAFLLGAKFCRKCGQRRPGDQVCSCGNVFTADALFCRECGRQRGSVKEKEGYVNEIELFEDPTALHSNAIESSSGTAPLFSSTGAADITETMSDTTPVVTAVTTVSSMTTSGSNSSQLHSTRKDAGAAAAAPRRAHAHTSNSVPKDCVKEDTKDITSSDTLSCKLRQRRVRRMRTKENLEQEEKNRDEVSPWVSKDEDSNAGDEPDNTNCPESAKPRARANARRRGKPNEKVKRSGTRPLNTEAKVDSDKKEISDTSDSDSSDSDGVKSPRASDAQTIVTAANSSASQGCLDCGSDHELSGSSEECAAVVKPIVDPPVIVPKASLKALRFSDNRKRTPSGADTSDQPSSFLLAVAPQPAEADAVEPQPPSEAAPELPFLNVPDGPLSKSPSQMSHLPQGAGGIVRSSMSVPNVHRHGSLLGTSIVNSLNGSTSMTSMGRVGSFSGARTSQGSFMQVNGLPSSRRGSVEWADDHSDDDEGFELLGVWSMQVWRKQTRVKREQNGDADEEDLDDDTCFAATTDAVEQEQGQNLTRKKFFKRMIIQPSSVMHLSWEMLGLILIMWDVIIIPLDVFEPRKSEAIDAMAWFLRVFWLLDIIISFMTGYLLDQGTLEMRPTKIAKHYLKTWFVPDTICVSMDWATVVLQTVDLYRGLRIVRTVRLVRLLKAPEIDAFISEHIHSDNIILAGNIIKIIILLMGVAHIIACVWYIVGRESSDPGAEGWVRFHDLTQTEVEDRYMWSLQWALGQFTGENVYEPRNMTMSERTYAVVILLLTFLFSAMFVSSITTSVTQLQLTKSTTAGQLTNLRRYLVDCDISTSLAVRVLRNAQHLVNEQKRNVPEQRIELLAVVSEPLRAELHFEVHGRVLREHSFFDCYTDVNPQGMRKVCHMAIHGSHVSRGDIIFSDLETPAWPRMFFIVSGKLQYKQVEEKPQALHKHQWAAEAVLWTLWMHVGTLRALGESDILAVEAEKFQHIIGPFPTNHAYLYANTFVECLNTVEEDILTDLDTNLVGSYLRLIFPERFHEEAHARNSDGVLVNSISPAVLLKSRTQSTHTTPDCD